MSSELPSTMACSASTASPLAMEPLSATGPSNHWRISWMSANGLFTPAWPPAPAATAIRPSAPLSIALLGAHFFLCFGARRTPPPPPHPAPPPASPPVFPPPAPPGVGNDARPFVLAPPLHNPTKKNFPHKAIEKGA